MVRVTVIRVTVLGCAVMVLMVRSITKLVHAVLWFEDGHDFTRSLAFLAWSVLEQLMLTCLTDSCCSFTDVAHATRFVSEIYLRKVRQELEDDPACQSERSNCEVKAGNDERSVSH